MSSDTAALERLETQSLSDETSPVIRWQRMTFAGITPGNPPRATFRAQGQTPNGSVRHFSQTLRVVDDALLIQLTNLSAGIEIRVCIETDWNTPDVTATLKDFCRIEADGETTDAPMKPTT